MQNRNEHKCTSSRGKMQIELSFRNRVRASQTKYRILFRVMVLYYPKYIKVETKNYMVFVTQQNHIFECHF